MGFLAKLGEVFTISKIADGQKHTTNLTNTYLSSDEVKTQVYVEKRAPKEHSFPLTSRHVDMCSC